jgi:hypothetical protein
MPLPSTNLSYMQTRDAVPCAAPASITNFAVLPIAGCPKSPKGLRGGPRQGHPGLGIGCLQRHLIVGLHYVVLYRKAELSLHGNAAGKATLHAYKFPLYL